MRWWFGVTVAMLVAACGSSGSGVDAGPDGAGVDGSGGDATILDTGLHPDVPPVLPDQACDGQVPVIAFSHGFEPGERLPDDPGYHGFEVVSGGACPGDTGGARSLAWTDTASEGSYASLPPVDLPAAPEGGLFLSFCLVFDAHDADTLRVDLLGDAGDPETVWSSPVGAALQPVVQVDLTAYAGQRILLSFQVDPEGEAQDPPRDVRLDSVTLFTCPVE